MINWNDAPEWAEYVAMDESGEWWWYEKEPDDAPQEYGDGFWCNGGIETEYGDLYGGQWWGDSLQERPK